MVRCWFVFLGCLVLFAAGCGNSSGLYPVSGEVTFQGQPLASGVIVFESADGNRGGATIEAGKYSIPAKLGLRPGSYTVRVSASQAPSSASAGPPGPEAAAIERANKDVIPDDFNSKSKLTYEAGPGKPATFDIAIP